MKIEKHGIIKPKPFFKITVGCSTRQFYGVVCELKDLSYECDEEDMKGATWNDYVSEKCDYEGDLEKLIIYPHEKCETFLGKVLEHFEMDPSCVPKDMKIEIVDL
jgi:hypothetical protein